MHGGLNPTSTYKFWGPDAHKLLDRHFTNRTDNMVVGASRHGVMCNEDGLLMNDGMLIKTGENEFVSYYARAHDGAVAADLSGIEGLVQRASELEDLGVSYMMVPSGLRRENHEEDDAFHRNTRAMGGTPLALVRNVMRGLSSSAEVAAEFKRRMGNP